VRRVSSDGGGVWMVLMLWLDDDESLGCAGLGCCAEVCLLLGKPDFASRPQIKVRLHAGRECEWWVAPN